MWGPPQWGFEDFWDRYPRKADQAAARRVWGQLAPSDTLVERMLAAIARQQQSDQWRLRRVIPNPATWLKKRGWEDELPSRLDVFRRFVERGPSAEAETPQEVRGELPERAHGPGRKALVVELLDEDATLTADQASRRAERIIRGRSESVTVWVSASMTTIWIGTEQWQVPTPPRPQHPAVAKALKQGGTLTKIIAPAVACDGRPPVTMEEAFPDPRSPRR